MIQARKYVEKFYTPAVFLFILAYFLAGLLLPFWSQNNLMAWDGAGLYFSAWYEKEYLFPGVIGWNPYFFFGAPQNQFYPPLYPYLSALLSEVMPLEWAFKLVLTIALLITPISFLWFAKSFRFSNNLAAAITVAMTALLFAFPDDFFGANMHSTFNIGMYANALALPFFFLYFGSLERHMRRLEDLRAIKKPTAKSKAISAIISPAIILPSILFSAIVLSHTITAIASLLVLVSYFIMHAKNGHALGFFGGHVMLSSLATAFWTLPAIMKYSWATVSTIGEISQPFWILELTIGYLLFLVVAGKKRFFPAGVFTLVLMGFVFVSNALLHLPIHPYRFMMFIYLLAPFAALSVFCTILDGGKKELAILFIVAIASVFAMVYVQGLHPEGPKPMELEKIDANISGRVMVIAPPNLQPSAHFLQNAIPMENMAPSLRGVFVESSRNAPFIFDMEKELDEGAIDWGIAPHKNYIPSDYSLITEILPLQMDLANTTRVVSFGNNLGVWRQGQAVGKFENRLDGGPVIAEYRLYRTGDSNLIQALAYKPRTIGDSNWDEEAARWFLSRDIKNGILVNEQVPENVGSGNEKIEMLEMSPRQDYIKFRIYAKDAVPILIKISHFPNWHAYQDGLPLHIFRASPYLMLVYGKGEIELKYEQLDEDIAGNILSILGALMALAILAKKHFRF